MSRLDERVSREELLRVLESVSPGLSRKELLQQSSCFAFSNGEVMTYNDEVFCAAKSPFADRLTGAVPAWPLLGILRKLPDKDVTVKADKKKMYILGRNKETDVHLQYEVSLPVDKVERPKKFRQLAPEFLRAVKIVRECAAEVADNQIYTYVHFHPDYMEACDRYQMIRYTVSTGVESDILVKRDALGHVSELGMTKMAEVRSWLFFKSPLGVTLACRRWADEYKDLADNLFEKGGDRLTLPPGLEETVKRAEEFSKEISDDNLVLVELRPGKIRVTGEGVSGRHKEWKKVDYRGKRLEFRVSPVLLAELVKEDDRRDCRVTATRLKVKGEHYVYVACLSVPKKKDPEPTEE